MRTLDRNIGLVAGGVGAAVYAACVLLLGINLLVSIAPAALVVVAVLLVSPGGPMGKRLTPTKAEAQCIADAGAKLEALASIAQEMRGTSTEPPKVLVLQILDKAGQILSVISHDANKFQAAEPFKVKYVEPLDDWLRKYIRVQTRGLDFAKRALDSAEQETLPRLLKEFSKLYENLHINDVAGLMQGNAVELTFPGIELNDEEFNQ